MICYNLISFNMEKYMVKSSTTLTAADILGGSCTKHDPNERRLFKDNLTFVLIIVHEKQCNMDIDNKYVKPIIEENKDAIEIHSEIDV